MPEDEGTHAAADGVDSLWRSLGLPDRLRDVNVLEEGLEVVASATLRDRAIATNTRQVLVACLIMAVLRQAR